MNTNPLPCWRLELSHCLISRLLNCHPHMSDFRGHLYDGRVRGVLWREHLLPGWNVDCLLMAGTDTRNGIVMDKRQCRSD